MSVSMTLDVPHFIEAHAPFRRIQTARAGVRLTSMPLNRIEAPRSLASAGIPATFQPKHPT